VRQSTFELCAVAATRESGPEKAGVGGSIPSLATTSKSMT
jgi:hypothetical protein